MNKAEGIRLIEIKKSLPVLKSSFESVFPVTGTERWNINGSEMKNPAGKRASGVSKAIAKDIAMFILNLGDSYGLRVGIPFHRTLKNPGMTLQNGLASAGFQNELGHSG
jgi:hypothetical protein